MGFMDLKKAYDRVNREVGTKNVQYNTGGKLFNGIKCMYVNSVGCVRVKGGESECFRII